MNTKTPPDWVFYAMVLGTAMVVALLASTWLRQAAP